MEVLLLTLTLTIHYPVEPGPRTPVSYTHLDVYKRQPLCFQSDFKILLADTTLNIDPKFVVIHPLGTSNV